MMENIQKVLLELGAGFSFVGRQVPVEVGGETYFLDLLFYHLKLRCFVVVELKAGKFLPEYAGKMQFYLSAVNATMKHPDDQQSIGMILCRTKHKLAVEYTLGDVNKPIAVASYVTKAAQDLPADLKGKLPTVEELETELSLLDDRSREDPHEPSP